MKFFAALFVLYMSSTCINSKTLYKETFEKGFSTNNKYLKVVGGAYKGKKCLQATHVPSRRGSARLGFKKALRPVKKATLSYFVRFSKNFEFVKGGKLPGLLGGPKKSTGCVQPQPADSWSVRVMWRAGGIASLYMYNQARRSGRNRCGLNYNTSFRFKPGKWHRIMLVVKVNSRKNKSNGYAVLKIDNKLAIKKSGVRFRATNSVRSLVTRFYFSNFYGGNSISWAPKKTTKIFFDNFLVTG